MLPSPSRCHHRRFRLSLCSVELCYPPSAVSPGQELLLVAAGPLALLAALLPWLLVHGLLSAARPDVLSKVIVIMALWAVLDPLAVFAVDAALGVSAETVCGIVVDHRSRVCHVHRHQGRAGPLLRVGSSRVASRRRVHPHIAPRGPHAAQTTTTSPKGAPFTVFTGFVVPRYSFVVHK